MKKLICLMLALFMGSCALAEGTETAAEVPVPDLDLSEMSGTFVYAQIYQMTVDPYSYVGKIVRLKGYYDVYEDAAAGVYYTACVVPDATACCAQGIEFVWAGEHVYPDEFPQRGDGIIVTGEFELYQEGETWYIHLKDATMELCPEASLKQS